MMKQDEIYMILKGSPSLTAFDAFDYLSKEFGKENLIFFLHKICLFIDNSYGQYSNQNSINDEQRISHHALNQIYIMIEPQPHSESSPPLPRFIQAEEHQLSQCLFQYYVNLRSDLIPSITTQIPQQFAKIQQEIIEVVELRKQMEATVQNAVAEQLHFETIAGLVDNRIKIEGEVDRLAQQVKQLQSKNVARRIEELTQAVKRSSRPERELIEQGQELAHQLSDFRREINLYSSSQNTTTPTETIEDDSPLITAFFAEQLQKWKLTKQIYGAKFRQLLLREQLIEERERAFFDYERTNSDLIEVLLHQKERDKNLRKKDKEKFEEMLKMRHQIDIENENLSHTQRTLNSRYQVELLKMKNQIQLMEGEHEKERQKMNKMIQAAQKERYEKQREKSEREVELEETIQELKMAFELANEQKKQKDKEIQQLKYRCQKLVKENTNLTAKLNQFQRIKQQNEEHNERLQSQHNELILKNSQQTQKKQEITQKLEFSNRKVEELQKENKKLQIENSSLKSLVDQKDKQSTKWQRSYLKANSEVEASKVSLAHLQKEKTHYEQKIVQQKITAQFNQEKIKYLQENAVHLEKQLTNIFIVHNEDHKQLLQQLENKTTLIAHLNEQLATQLISPESLTALRSDILSQMQRASQQKNCLIDSFLNRLDCLPL